MTKQQLLDKLKIGDDLVKMTLVPVSEVIKWIDELESETLSEDIIDDIVDEIVGEDMDLISDYELEMNYREVELNSISIDSERIERAIKRALSKH